ncbi:hypothetical protein AKO1_007505 [Acrasis kona]|uniref:Uncharacterized protein n=1 Tax=Acrasis kona TaxID=1008807 RepID=A0AAW2YSX2_9EUKA
MLERETEPSLTTRIKSWNLPNCAFSIKPPLQTQLPTLYQATPGFNTAALARNYNEQKTLTKQSESEDEDTDDYDPQPTQTNQTAFSRRNAVGPINRRQNIQRVEDLLKSYSILLVISIRNQNKPFFVNPVLDNAKIHSGVDTFPTTLKLLRTAGVIIVWLPTYSP